MSRINIRQKYAECINKLSWSSNSDWKRNCILQWFTINEVALIDTKLHYTSGITRVNRNAKFRGDFLADKAHYTIPVPIRINQEKTRPIARNRLLLPLIERACYKINSWAFKYTARMYNDHGMPGMTAVFVHFPFMPADNMCTPRYRYDVK